MGIQSQFRIAAIKRCKQRGASRQTPAYRQAAVNDISTDGFVSLLHCEICKGNEANKINKALSKPLIRVPHRPHDKRCMKENRNTPSSKRKSSTPGEALPTKKSRKSVATKKRESEAQEIAKRAAALAEQTVANPEMAKKLLLSMALVQENQRTLPSTWPPRGSVVPEGFFWKHYPPLQAALKKHMAEYYYNLSTTKRRSAQQQAFSNDLVILVRDVATEQGWKIHQTFSDERLRDRIRSYYKTRIRLAKQRLRTMVRNPTKRANAQHLCSHLDLIEQHAQNESEVEQEEKEEEKVTAPVATPAN